MIKVIKPGGGIYAPVIACDFCGKPINDGKGNFLWNPDTEGEITEIYFSHKGCDNSLEHALLERGIHTMWMDLDLFMLWLVNNSKVDLKEAEKSHKFLKEQGLVS
jgi:hypothetical protein